MDSERIISEVFYRPALWDKKHKCYHNRVLVEKLWRSIATKMNVPKEDLKKKWKGLRDQFRSELRKFPLTQSADAGDTGGDGTQITSSWHYFRSLLFLKDQIRDRKLSVNSKPTKATIECQDETQDNCNTSEMDNIDNMSDEFISELPNNKNSTAANTGASQMAMEKRKLELLERKSSQTKPLLDEDEAFFLTLLPHIRKLEPQNKFLCRMDIQNVLYKYVYGRKPPMSQLPNESSQYTAVASPISTASDWNNVYSMDQSSFDVIQIENVKCEKL